MIIYVNYLNQCGTIKYSIYLFISVTYEYLIKWTFNPLVVGSIPTGLAK